MHHTLSKHRDKNIAAHSHFASRTPTQIRMAEKLSNKWDIMLSLFTSQDSLKQEYLRYNPETVTIKELYSVNVIR